MMKKSILASRLLLLTLLAIGTKGMAQEPRLTAFFGYATFELVDGDPYIETYLNYDAWNLRFVKAQDGSYRATVETLLFVMRDDSVVFAKKYDLNSPAIDDTLSNKFNFLDVQRFTLKNGIYTLRIELRDKAYPANKPVIISQKVLINYGMHPQLSSVQLMAGMKPTVTQNMLSRGGYDMEPYVNDFLPASMQKVYYYYEIYRINREIFGAEFMTLAFIEQMESGRKMQGFQQIQKHNGNKKVVVAGGLDISALPSGNYNLVVEVRNKKNDLMLFQKVPFMRSNPAVMNDTTVNPLVAFAGDIEDENMLNYYLKALYPIASPVENGAINEITKQPGHIGEKQSLFYNFWVKRNSLDPRGEWRKYKDRLDYVAVNFSYPKIPGYLTDRGRVYLQYGPPDFIRDEKNFVSVRVMDNQTMSDFQTNSTRQEQNMGQIFYLPYQIWRYNNIKGDDPNRCFLFWDELRSGSYKLLHSNAKGEVNMPNWERMLSNRQLGEEFRGEVSIQFDRGY
ncbi:MAG: GWxTD domain-containing protein [Bacteroidales bacterium]|nr:GWxTD domain-containing protein [Bacteroidales bacterium]